MEGGIRSGGVLKKMSSSGCLIIKKKVENQNWEDLSFNSKEKKRPRLAPSDLGVSEDDDDDDDESLEFVSGKRLHNGSMGYKRSELETRVACERTTVGIDISGGGGGRKRAKLDLFGLDEYDERRNSREFGVGSSHKNSGVEKRQSPYFDGSRSGRNKGFELEEDEAEMPTSLLRLKYHERCDEPIRLQGKNGVLKVMVNKKKRMMDLHSHHKKYDPREFEERVGPQLEDVPKREFSPRLLVYPDSRPPEKEKMDVKLERIKPKPNKVVKVREMESDGTDTSLKLGPPGIQASSSLKKREVERAPPENVKGKVKRGGSTEKQMLREKIREMLVEAGWTIDYRPRRNRDYLDAVYINPSGTAYWSIIKAYDALKKQLEEDRTKRELVLDSSLFAPLSEDLINKLTRQTKKKIEEEMRRKRKEDGVSKIAKKCAVREVEESSDSDDDDSPKRKPGKFASNSNVLQGRTSKVIGRCTLLIRRGENGGYVPYSGKRTVLGWLIDSGAAQLSEKVQYMNRKRTRVILEGWITRDGIHCGCCSKILSVSKFELHAGSKLRQPFQNIFLESGASLLQCQIDAWNRQGGEAVGKDFHTVGVDGDDPDDDTCGICGDGGSLICCDSCPSTFHQICLDIQMLPSGDWHCPNCVCKFCGSAAEEDDSAADELIRCSFCEKRYHNSCSEEVFALSMSSNGASFCGLKCQELYDRLQKILGVKHELEAGYSWSLIQRTDVSDTSHRGFPQRVESNSKLAVALSVMDECFLPIIDRRSGINMIRNAVFNIGSNFNRLNYRQFYTAILERGDEIVCAASIRIHGTRLAEMPFIGTREIYRRQGMCRRLLSAIETELRSLEVEQLIIPAISEHTNTWTTIFGFHQLEDAIKKEIKSVSMLVFPGTDMLQKQLLKHSDGTKVSDPIKNRSPPSVPNEKCDTDSSDEQKEPSAPDDACRAEALCLKPDLQTTVNNGSVESAAQNASPSVENITYTVENGSR